MTASAWFDPGHACVRFDADFDAEEFEVMVEAVAKNRCHSWSGLLPEFKRNREAGIRNLLQRAEGALREILGPVSFRVLKMEKLKDDSVTPGGIRYRLPFVIPMKSWDAFMLCRPALEEAETDAFFRDVPFVLLQNFRLETREGLSFLFGPWSRHDFSLATLDEALQPRASLYGLIPPTDLRVMERLSARR